MKKSIKYILMLLVVTLLLGGCNKQTTEPEDESGKQDNLVTIFINTEGIGQISATNDGTEPQFDEDHPFTQAIFNTAVGSEIKMEARQSEESYVFVNWTKDGEFFSEETKLTVTATEQAEYVAHFEWVENTEEAAH